MGSTARRRAGTTRKTLSLLAAAAYAWLPPTASAFEAEMGPVTVQNTLVTPAWTTVTFIRPFPVRPVVVALPTNDGGDPATVRIRNVTTTGFEIVQPEPSANDGPHVAMPTAYLAIEPGDHVLPDGSRLVVLEHTTTSFANRLISTTWDTIFFPSSFSGAPAVVAAIQTMANESQAPPTSSSVPFMDVGIQSVGPTSLQVTLERAESTAGSVSVAERIGIVAIESGLDISFTDALGSTVQLQSLLTPGNVRGWDNGCFTNSYPASFPVTPLAVASANSRAGNNGGWVRRCSQSSTSLGLTIDEDTDNDAERSHIGESAGIIAASIAFHANLAVDILISKAVSSTADPFNGASNPKSIPDADIEYTIGVTNRGSSSPDVDTLVITDDVPPQLRLCVTAGCLAGGPVVFDDSGSPVPTGLSLGTVEYSNNGGATYTYVPVPDVAGFDDAVNAIRVTLSGTMAAIAPAGQPSFALRFAARIN